MAAAIYATVFVADFFFKTDLRIWCFTIKAFTPDKLVIAAKFLPFFPIVVILPVFVFISRSIYKATKNPYLAGIIMAIIVTIMSCTNTLSLG